MDIIKGTYHNIEFALNGSFIFGVFFIGWYLLSHTFQNIEKNYGAAIGIIPMVIIILVLIIYNSKEIQV